MTYSKLFSTTTTITTIKRRNSESDFIGYLAKRRKLDIEDEIDLDLAQEFPHHILNALNDDCIQEILRRLSNVCDFTNAANTCKKFQENAKKCFNGRFKTITLDTTSDDFQPHQFTKTLETFGKMIESIDWKMKHSLGSKLENELFDDITHYCGTTLTELKMIDVSGSSDPINLKCINRLALLDSLENLEITRINTQFITLPSSLKVLKLDQTVVNDNPKIPINITEYYSSLQEIDFSFINQEVVIKFLELNPRLKVCRLTSIKNIDGIKSDILKKIVEFTPNIETLAYLQFSSDSVDQSDIMVLTGLRKLKNLRVSGLKCSEKDLVDTFAKDVTIDFS